LHSAALRVILYVGYGKTARIRRVYAQLMRQISYYWHIINRDSYAAQPILVALIAIGYSSLLADAVNLYSSLILGPTY
jgi:hypothetical protein